MRSKTKKTTVASAAAVLILITSLFFGTGDNYSTYKGTWEINSITQLSSDLSITIPDEANVDYWQLMVNDSFVGEVNALKSSIRTVPVMLSPIDKIKVVLFRGTEPIGAARLLKDGLLDVRVNKTQNVKAATPRDISVINNKGTINVFGRIEGAVTGASITILMQEKGVAFPQGIKYINQDVCAANGSFVFRFKLPSKDTGKLYTLKIGGKDISPPFLQDVNVERYRALKSEIEDNSIMIGKDVYNLASSALTADNILASMKNGGNQLYYKIGGRWYDLIKAESSQYFISSNAEQDSKVNSWKLNRWYPLATVESFEFEN